MLVVIYFISPLCGVAETPDCGMLVIYLLYKPFMWCRLDARLWHCLLFNFFISPLCGVAQTPDCGILFGLHYCSFMLHINNLFACISDFIYDWRCDHRILQCMNIIYIIPMFILFVSTFKVLTGLSLAIVLARFLAWRGALQRQPRNLINGDSRLRR